MFFISCGISLSKAGLENTTIDIIYGNVRRALRL